MPALRLKSARVAASSIALAIVFSSHFLLAAPAPAKNRLKDAAAADKSPDEIQRAIEREKSSSKQLAAKETSLLGKLADLERQVELEGRGLRAAQAKLKVAQVHLSAAEEKANAAQAEVDAATQALGPRLTARYQLGREGYVRFLLGSRSVVDLLRRKRLYSALLKDDLDAIAALRSKALGAATAKNELQAARDELAQSASVEQEKRSALELKAALQKRALTSVQQEKGLHEQAARELEQAARALAERLRAIDEAKRAGKAIPLDASAAGPPPAAGESEHGTDANSRHANSLSANNGEIAPPGSPAPANPSAANPPAPANALAANGSASFAPAPGNSAPAPAANGSAASVEPPGKKLAMIGPPMRTQRGKLLFPVDKGRVEVRFGRTVDKRFGTITLQRGLDIRGEQGAEVHAVYAGTVVHAGWFSGYGNLVILDHGDGLFSLFAHLETLAHAVGEQVAKGEVIGTLGDTGSLKGPYLYFELRDGQKPLDPERWLSRNRAKAPPHK